MIAVGPNIGLWKLGSVGRWQQLIVHAEHLRELERPALELAEGFINAAGIRFIQGLAGGGSRRLRYRALAIIFQLVHPHPSAGSC